MRNLVNQVGLILLFVACTTGLFFLLSFIMKGVNSFSSPEPSANKLKISTITTDDIFDLSGSAYSGGSDFYRLFDENRDPKNGISTAPVTNPMPVENKSLFYPQGKGLRVVIDLRAVHNLTDVYFYDASFGSDSVWVYAGEMDNWKEIGQLKTALLPVSWGWRNFTTDTDTRYLMLRFKSPKVALSEVVLYGKAKEKLAARNAAVVDTVMPKPTLRQFMGTNSYDYVPVELMKPFSTIRMYRFTGWFDQDTVAYPLNKLTLNPFSSVERLQFRAYADSLKKNGNEIWLSLRGVSPYLDKFGAKETEKPVTVWGMNTEDPASYARHAKVMWTMAASYGTTKVDTGLIDIRKEDNEWNKKYSGTGLMTRYENGNEEDASWTGTYWSPLEYFAMSSADYDGHERKLGPGLGIKQADPNSRLMMSGMIGLDTTRVKVLNFLCRTKRNDRAFLWDAGVQYHHYSNDGIPGKFPTGGIVPEAQNLRKVLKQVRDFQSRLLPGIPAILGENGYDRHQKSWQRVPILPGYNAEQSQGILVIRSMMATLMAGFDQYNQFMVQDAGNDGNSPNVFATSGFLGGKENGVIYQGWYYWSTIVNQLGDYQPDAIVSEQGKVWIYKLRHRSQPGQVAYYLVSPTGNGTTIKNYSFKIGALKSQDIKEISLADKSPVGREKTLKASGENVLLDVGESPIFLLAEEK